MKKIKGLLLCMFLMSACSTKESVSKDVSILIPTGAPAVSHVELAQEQKSFSSGKTTYDFVGADAITANMTSGSYDIIIAPTNLGVKLIQKGANYQIAAIITTGNLYVVGRNKEITDIKEIVVFGMNSVPDHVLQAVLKANGLEVDLRYVDDVAMAQAEILSGNADYVLLAEPALTATQGKIKEKGQEPLEIIFDLQEEFSKISGHNGYPQAAVFVKKDLSQDIVNAYLSELEQSMEEWAINAPTLSETISQDLEDQIGVKAQIIGKTYVKMGLNYHNAFDMKEDIDIFLEIFGLEATTEDLYYQK